VPLCFLLQSRGGKGNGGTDALYPSAYRGAKVDLEDGNTLAIGVWGGNTVGLTVEVTRLGNFIALCANK
jgi:hypothetical protein